MLRRSFNLETYLNISRQHVAARIRDPYSSTYANTLSMVAMLCSRV